MLFSENKTLNIGGMAISNVFYKDVDFWGYLSPVRKRLKALKDRYRIWRYKKLDYWVFETDLLKEKAVNDFGFPEGHVFVIKMAPSLLVRPENVFELEKTNIIKSRPSKYKFAFVSGAHPNKRLHLLPEIARNLKDSGFSFDFVLTASNNSYLESVMSEAKELGVYENFLNLGPVSAGEVASVIDACDYVCTFSLLESFSNNFVEAWAMKKPLIVTDADWSRSACKNSAIYLDFKSVDFVTSQIIEAIKNDVVTREIVRNGAEILKIYPTPLEKTREYIDLIYMLKDKGKIKKEQLGEIKL
jgi:glycosyltransferase involved in cell wall biosynthesis